MKNVIIRLKLSELPNILFQTGMLYVSQLTRISADVSSKRCFFLQPDCDSTIQIPSQPASLAECSMPCSGNANETCGGPDLLNVFLDTAVPPPVIVQDVNGTQGGLWTYDGCFTSVLSFLSRRYPIEIYLSIDFFLIFTIIDAPVVIRYLRERWVTE